jgi:hypothetical protein
MARRCDFALIRIQSRISAVPVQFSVMILALVWIAPVACADPVPKADATVNDGSTVLGTLEPGIHPVISIPGWTPDAGEGSFEVHLHLISVGVSERIGSFQGELRYDSQVVEVLDGEVPIGLLGAWNITGPGVIKLAGVNPEGLGASAVLSLTVHASGSLQGRHFEVRLEEVSAAEGFGSLRHQVVQRPHPVITRERVGVDPT